MCCGAGQWKELQKQKKQEKKNKKVELGLPEKSFPSPKDGAAEAKD